MSVQMSRMSLEGYFDAMSAARVVHIPIVKDLKVTEEYLQKSPVFYSEVADIPLRIGNTHNKVRVLSRNFKWMPLELRMCLS